MSPKKFGIGAAALAAAGAVALGGSALANAAGSSTVSAISGYATTASPSDGAAPGAADGQRPAPHQHTDVTGDELTKVTAAVTAKDSSATVTSVQQDPDGSYDVHATKDGQPVMFEVSADLQTISEGRGPGGPGGPGRHQHTDVTGDELASVTAAVKAQDATVTVDSVQKDPDGSYDVHATKDGQPVMFEVSADQKTVTQAPARGPGPGGPGGHGKRGPGGAPGQPGAATPQSSGTSTTT